MNRTWCLIALAVLCMAGEARAEVSIPVQTILLEAEGEGFEGMVAVAEVIRNRAIKRSQTHEAVCLAPYQFSAWNAREYAQKRLERVSGGSLALATKAWEASKGSNKARGATHYHTLAVRPYWAKGHAPTVIIGNHAFYTGVK